MAYTYDALQVGDSFSTSQVISADDVQGFADVTGDDNPIHLDPEYARQSRFGETVVHGVLVLGVVSKVLGRDFPGHGSIAVAMNVKFLRPVPVGSEVTVEVKIAEKIDARKHVRARIAAYVNNKMCVGGEAVIIPPEA